MQFCGMHSPIFESRGEQVIRQIRVAEASNYEEWIPKEREETMYKSDVCKPATLAEITDLINSHKSDRAPGVDGVQADMLKHASAPFIQTFTEVINEILESGEVPSVLLTGKMTLIDKKKPSLEVSEKRPLTVPNLFLSVLTRRVFTEQCSMDFGQAAAQKTAYLQSWQLFERLNDNTGRSRSPFVTWRKHTTQYAENSCTLN